MIWTLFLLLLGLWCLGASLTMAIGLIKHGVPNVAGLPVRWVHVLATVVVLFLSWPRGVWYLLRGRFYWVLREGGDA